MSNRRDPTRLEPHRGVLAFGQLSAHNAGHMHSRAATVTDKPIDPRELEAAFSLFNEASAQLSSAYSELQGQVEQLAGELAVANGELKRQYLEKEALSSRLKTLLDALPGGVVVLDADARVIELNPAARELLGDGAIAQPWHELTQSRLEPTSLPHEWTLSRVTGSRRIAVSESSLDSSGARIMLLNDITDAARMQQQLEQHKKLSAMGEMAAGLAHQLRTPLATALLYAANLSKTGLAEADRLRFSERVRERLRYLERMIQEMLMFVRGEPVGDEVFDLSAVIDELAQIIEPQMTGRGVRFDVHDAAAHGRVRGGRKALSGALLNLLENALQASESGGRVELKCECSKTEARINVTDDGVGIDPKVHERLFEPFFTTRAEGTGLGLAIVRTVVEAHGGEVSVQSAIGKGSTFSVRIPLDAQAVAA